MLSHPGAFVAAAAHTAGWAFAEADLRLARGAIVAALFMTLFIQRATHRDTQALHAKLDELLHMNQKARDVLAQVDQEPEDIE